MLYVVATPIGNLQDITLRALETLKTVDKVYCEDTRRSALLLRHFNINKPLESLHHHSSQEKINLAVTQMKSGLACAYLSDAGTPGIADPGGKLVEACYQAGVKVTPIPGASAVSTLLSVAGLPADSFWFAGFVPTKKGRQTFIKKILEFPEMVVIYETAPRLIKFLSEVANLDKEREIVVGRELTKQFEEILRGTAPELLEYFQKKEPRGELVVAISKKN